MIKLFKIVAVVAVVAVLAVGLASAQAVLARQNAPADQGNSFMENGMQNGGMMGMQNMMQQMTKMMETCNSMMENHRHVSKDHPQ